MRIIPIAFLLLTIVSGCGKRETVLAPQITNLAGEWRLIEPASPYTVTLRLTFDTTNPPLDVTPFFVAGESPINEYMARLFATVDGTMQVSGMGNTEVAGPPEETAFEQAYLTDLKAVARYELTGTNQLRMYHGGPKPGVLVYEKQH